jgi:hypothetical protein
MVIITMIDIVSVCFVKLCEVMKKEEEKKKKHYSAYELAATCDYVWFQ